MIIAANKSGQMCNQVIEFMHLYAMAIEYRQKLIQLYSSDYESVFCCTDHENICKRFRLQFAAVIRKTLRSLLVKLSHKPIAMARQDHNLLKQRIRSGHSVIVKDSFLRDFEALESQKESIKYYFSFKENVKQKGDIVFQTLNGYRGG